MLSFIRTTGWIKLTGERVYGARGPKSCLQLSFDYHQHVIKQAERMKEFTLFSCRPNDNNFLPSVTTLLYWSKVTTHFPILILAWATSQQNTKPYLTRVTCQRNRVIHAKEAKQNTDISKSVHSSFILFLSLISSCISDKPWLLKLTLKCSISTCQFFLSLHTFLNAPVVVVVKHYEYLKKIIVSLLVTFITRWWSYTPTVQRNHCKKQLKQFLQIKMTILGSTLQAENLWIVAET